MQFRPCIDLRHGRVTQIIGSTLQSTESHTSPPSSTSSPSPSPSADSAHENFSTDRPSSYYASLYASHSLHGGHVIMLGPGNDAAARLALSSYPLGLQVGGGIDPSNALQWLDAGASHVIVTSHLFVDGELSLPRLHALSALVTPARLVIDLSCRRREVDGPYYVVTDRWQKYTGLEVTGRVLKELSPYCAEFLVHGVDVEGKRQGVERDLLSVLAGEGEEGGEGGGGWNRVVYAGGVKDMEDIKTVQRIGRGRIDVSVGSALDIFGGDLPFDDVVAFCKGAQGQGGGEAGGSGQ